MLTQPQADRFRQAIPALIRARFRGETPQGNLRCAIPGDEAGLRLCYPLSETQLRRIRACREIFIQQADVVCCTDFDCERLGVITFRCSYHFEGLAPSGERLSIRETGWIFADCRVVKGVLTVTGAEGYPDGTPDPAKLHTPNGFLPPEPRKARERLLRQARRENAKRDFWGGLAEVILEFIFH